MVLEYRNITKKFGNKEAVKRAYFEVEKGHDLWSSRRKWKW